MRNYKRIEEKLHEAQIALDNAMANPTIASAVAEYGYNDVRMAEGKTLYNQAVDLHRKQMAEYGDKYEATETLHKAWDTADKVYINTFKIARIALRNKKKAWSALYLAGRTKQSLIGWLDHATTFYSNLLSDVELMKEMKRFAYDRERLLSEQALVEAVAEANNMKKSEKGEAEEATLERNRKIDQLDEWIGDFLQIAEIALEDCPQQLEKLGITAA
jgi:hypothetical protein